MDLSLQKTLTFILFIGIGLLLKFKFKSSEEKNGIKKIILNLALPATIFIALLGIKIDQNLLWLPVLALGLNLALYFIFPVVFPLLGFPKDSPHYRTARLLIPSLAPGLSCFPFILEYLGKDYLAKAAMADLGNKVFVLIILYIIAMRWHYTIQNTEATSNTTRLKALLVSLLSEPVNIFIAAALILVGFGLNMEKLPFVISETLQRLSLMMTPLVLLFIGLAVNIRKKQFVQVLAMLTLRAGFVTFIIAIGIMLTGITATHEILFLLAFGLSACSFWPFAHIAVVGVKERDITPRRQTFNSDFAVNILALSLPFSVVLILIVLSSGETFGSASRLFILAGLLILGGILPIYLLKMRSVMLLNRQKKNKKQGEGSYEVTHVE